MIRPQLVDLSFRVTRVHQKRKALFCRINFDYRTNSVKKHFVFFSVFFLLSTKKQKRKVSNKLDHALKFTLTSI